jgi:hypothetical protein
MSFKHSVLTAGSWDGAVSFNLAAAIKPGAPIAKSPVLIPANEGLARAMLILVAPPKSAGPNRERRFEVWLLLNAHALAAPSYPKN